MSPPLALAAGALLAGAAACGNGSGTAITSATVKSGDDFCHVGRSEFPSGKVRLDVHNVGSDVTEVYVYGEGDNGKFDDVKGEQENIGPGTDQTLDVRLTPGQYRVVCKPGMKGEGIPADISVRSDERNSGGGPDHVTYDQKYEFQVGSDGSVTGPPEMSARHGASLKLDLENDESSDYYLKMVSPDGSELTSIEAPGKQRAEGNVVLGKAGEYHIRIYESGHESSAKDFKVEVK